MKMEQNPNYPPNWLYHFAFPLAMNESYFCFPIPSTFGVASVLDFDYFNRYAVHLIVLIFIPMMTYSSASFLLRSMVHFLTGLFVFLLLNFETCLYILDVSFANIVSQSVLLFQLS